MDVIYAKLNATTKTFTVDVLSLTLLDIVIFVVTKLCIITVNLSSHLFEGYYDGSIINHTTEIKFDYDNYMGTHLYAPNSGCLNKISKSKCRTFLDSAGCFSGSPALGNAQILNKNQYLK